MPGLPLNFVQVVHGGDLDFTLGGQGLRFRPLLTGELAGQSAAGGQLAGNGGDACPDPGLPAGPLEQERHAGRLECGETAQRNTPPFSKKRLSSRLSPLQTSLLRGPELAIFLESGQDYTLRPTFRNGLIFRLKRQKGRGTYIMKNGCRGREARGKTSLPAGGPLDGGGHVFRTGTRETEGGEPHFRFAGTAALPNDKREADSCFFS